MDNNTEYPDHPGHQSSFHHRIPLYTCTLFSRPLILILFRVASTPRKTRRTSLANCPLASGRPASLTGQKNSVATAFARLVEEAHAWCGVEHEEHPEEAPASLKHRLEGTVRNLRCRLAIG